MEIELESIKGKIVVGQRYDCIGDTSVLTIRFDDGTRLRITTYLTASVVLELMK